MHVVNAAEQKALKTIQYATLAVIIFGALLGALTPKSLSILLYVGYPAIIIIFCVVLYYAYSITQVKPLVVTPESLELQIEEKAQENIEKAKDILREKERQFMIRQKKEKKERKKVIAEARERKLLEAKLLEDRKYVCIVCFQNAIIVCL